jgi:hypothetical protein
MTATVAPADTGRRHKRVQRIGGGVMRKYRNKGAAAHPKRKRNRLHVSRRVRRAHRRARK